MNCEQITQNFKDIGKQYSTIDASLTRQTTTKEGNTSKKIIENIIDKTFYGEIGIEAKNIFGNDFLGASEVSQAFDCDIKLSQIPPIPFSKTELEKARENEMMLVFRIEKMGRYGFTVEGLDRIFRKKTGEHLIQTTAIEKSSRGYLDVYGDVRPGWALVSKEPFNYDGYYESSPTWHIFSAILDLYKMSDKDKLFISPEIKVMMDEFDKLTWDEVNRVYNPRLLTSPKVIFARITHEVLRSPAETAYDLALYYLTNKKRLLEKKLTYTNRVLDNATALTTMGDFASFGAAFHKDYNFENADRYGVTLSIRKGALKTEQKNKV